MTKEMFKEKISEVQKLMEGNEYELLFWIVSSHGGNDSHGEFFYDTNLKR